MERPDIIERAFQIAPDCRSLTEVRARLMREGYAQVEAHLQGMMIKREIKQRLKPVEANSWIDSEDG